MCTGSSATAVTNETKKLVLAAIVLVGVSVSEANDHKEVIRPGSSNHGQRYLTE